MFIKNSDLIIFNNRLAFRATATMQADHRCEFYLYDAINRPVVTGIADIDIPAITSGYTATAKFTGQDGLDSSGYTPTDAMLAGILNNPPATLVNYYDNYDIEGRVTETASTTAIPGWTSRRRFGGKEFEDHHDPDIYDFEARSQDPALGLFHTIDPKAKENYSVFPYSYCNANPITYVDSTGENPVYAIYGIYRIARTVLKPVEETHHVVRNFNSQEEVRKIRESLVKSVIYLPSQTANNSADKAAPKTEQHHGIPRQLKGEPIVQKGIAGGFKFDGKKIRLKLRNIAKIPEMDNMGIILYILCKLKLY